MNNYSDLTQGPISKQILNIAIPASVGAIFFTLYNVTDTYFASMLSTAGLSALSLSFPTYLLLMAFSSGFNAAGVASMAHAVGAKDDTKRYHIFTHLVYITLIITAVFYILAPGLLKPLFQTLNAEGESLKYAVQYMKIIIWGFPISMLVAVFNGLLNATGDTKTFRNVQIASAILNVALDPLFLFGYGIIPPMGIAGIAFATIFSQFLGMLYLTYILRKKRLLAGLHKTHWKWDSKLLKDLTNQAYPQIFNVLMISGGIFIINFYLSKLGQDSAIAAYGVGVRIEQIALLPGMGLNVAVLAMIGQNMGAQNYDRIHKIFTKALKMGAVIMVGMLLIILPPAKFWIGLFNTEASVAKIAFEYLMVAGFTYYCYLLLFCCGSFLQAIKKPHSITWIGIARQVVAPWIFFFLIFNLTNWGELGIFIAIGVINWLAALTLLVISHYHLRRLSKTTKTTESESK